MPRANSLIESVTYNHDENVAKVVFKNGTVVDLNIGKYPESISNRFLDYGICGKIRNTLAPVINKENADKLAVEVLSTKDKEWKAGDWRTVVEGTGAAVLNLWAETYKRLLPKVTNGKVNFQTDAEWKEFEATLPDATAARFQALDAFQAMRAKIHAERKAAQAEAMAESLEDLSDLDLGDLSKIAK